MNPVGPRLALCLLAVSAAVSAAACAPTADVRHGSMVTALVPPRSGAGGLGGYWRLEVSVFPGSPNPGLYAGTLELGDDGGTITGRIDDWSNGVHSTLTGRRQGTRVVLEREDGPPGEGFRAVYDGTLSGGGGVLIGRYAADPHSPHGNAAQGTFRAVRLTDRPISPPEALLGSFRILLAVADGFPSAGRYEGTLVLGADGAGLVGTVDDWSNGARSSFRGQWDGARLMLLRTDGPPWEGMRARFDGWLADDGSLVGTFANDPTSPHGSGAAGTFRATRR